MPLFSYKVVDKSGKEIKGITESESRNTLKMKLQSEGLFVSDIKEKSSKDAFDLTNLKMLLSLRSKKASLDEVASMTRLLATLQKASIPLVEALGAVAEQQQNAYLKETMMLVKNKIQEGYSFSRSAKDFPDTFSDLYCNMIAAGEESGALDKVLLRLADFLESQLDLKNRVRSAMTYPIILLVMSIIVISIMFIVVVPKLSEMFDSMDMELPIQTKFMIGLSSFFSNYWWLVIIVAVGGFISFKRYIKTEKGLFRWDKFLINVKIFGRINRMIAISRFAKTLATLLNAGVPILKALDIVKKVVGNKVLETAIAVAKENIKEGESISVPLKRSGEFPPIVISMISIGEQSGELESMLETLADSYEKEVRYTLERLTSMIEPIMLATLGLVIGFIIFSIIVPIFKINESIG